METNLKNSIIEIEHDKVQYFRGTEIDVDLVHKAFTIGFSDYIIKLELPKEQFINLFFGPEGNDLEHTFVAIYENEPVGVVLGGIKNYENIKTMRCGTLAISPNFRGKGISQKLMELHKEEAEKYNCKQLFLEVIVGNDRAIHFYNKLGYEKIYDISYFSKKDLSNFDQFNPASDCKVEMSEFQSFKKVINKWNYHINWQNDIDFLEKAPNITYYVANLENENVGALAINSSGKISFLMVDPEFRNKKVASKLIQTAFRDLNLTAFSAGFPNNSNLEGYLKTLGFTKEKLSQYEMYRILNTQNS